MSEYPSYESMVADPKLDRFVSHHQPNHEQTLGRDSCVPCSADNDSVSSGRTEHSEPSAMNDLKGLIHDQAGMEWASNLTLRSRAQDDSLQHPEELQGYPLSEKVEVLNEDGQIIGQALTHETSPGKTVQIAPEHPFYKLKPDRNGQYHCPYNSLEDCWYRPQKLKSKFQ